MVTEVMVSVRSITPVRCRISLSAPASKDFLSPSLFQPACRAFMIEIGQCDDKECLLA